jgi:hypothetical protein
MARLSSASSTHIWDQPDAVKMAQALEWLRENPDEKPTTTARIYHIKNEQSVQQSWRRERKQIQEGKKPSGAGQNKILQPDQH